MALVGASLNQPLNESLKNHVDHRARRQKLLDLVTLITRAAREQATVDTIADEALSLLEDLDIRSKFEIK